MQLEQGFALYRRGPGFTSVNLLLSRSRFWLTGTTLIELGSWSVMVFTINKKNHSKYTRGVPHTIHTKTTTTVLVQSDDRNRHHQSK